MKKIGFIGLGNMGSPMALNLVRKGFELTVYDIREEVLDEFIQHNVTVRKSPKQVAIASDVIITMLPSSPDVEQVVLGKDGVIEGMKVGSILIDMSTISPIITRKIAEKLEEKGCKMLDAPVTKGVEGAKTGTLTIIVGGELGTLESCRDILSAMGEKIYYVGNIGSGEVLKLINNFILATNVAVLSEALVLGVKYGVPPDTLVEVLEASSANSYALQNHIKKYAMKGNFKNVFPVTYIMKDLDLILETGKGIGVPMPFAALTYQAYAFAKAKGKGKEYYPTIITLLEDLLNVKVRSKE